MSSPPWLECLPPLSVWSRHRRDGYAPWAFELVIIFSMMLPIAAATPISAHLGSAADKHGRPAAATIARTSVGIRRRQWPVSDRLYVQAIGIGQTEA